MWDELFWNWLYQCWIEKLQLYGMIISYAMAKEKLQSSASLIGASLLRFSNLIVLCLSFPMFIPHAHSSCSFSDRPIIQKFMNKSQIGVLVFESKTIFAKHRWLSSLLSWCHTLPAQASRENTSSIIRLCCGSKLILVYKLRTLHYHPQHHFPQNHSKLVFIQWLSQTNKSLI